MRKDGAVGRRDRGRADIDLSQEFVGAPPKEISGWPNNLCNSYHVPVMRNKGRAASGDQHVEARAILEWTRRAFAGALLATLCASIALAQEVHFSPEEKLDAIDAGLIASATRSIDFASYSLTDSIVLDALLDADKRGVAVRIVLDPRERQDFGRLGDLADNVRIKHSGPFMHLKAYAIDGELLRTGSANFSTSGERQQDNDLIVIRDAKAAAQFDAHFERMWDAAQPMIEFEPAIRALEPR
jgi:phosphatidylserine/phosphatidylglycerophosphate/cardiolipin synthase-like enzyme